MKDAILEMYWHEVPIGKENALTYYDLCHIWGAGERQVRKILHDLSLYDNGDDFILIRSGSGKGFYKTDDPTEIEAYKRECLSKGKSIFAPVKKINRVLSTQSEQYSFINNLRIKRIEAGLKQSEVCERMQIIDPCLDIPMLSRMENGACMPTPYQLIHLAAIYGCEPVELVGELLYI